MKDPIDREWFAKAFDLRATHRIVIRWAASEWQRGYRPVTTFSLGTERFNDPNQPFFTPNSQPRDWDVWKGPMK